MPGVYFADTFYWIALAHPKDAWHASAIHWATAHHDARLVTTEEVLTEFLNWFSGRGSAGRALAAQVVHSVQTSSSTLVLPQTSNGFTDALAFYEARPDKEYSLVDCRTMVALRVAGISEVLTNDRHFAQEGFMIVFP